MRGKEETRKDIYMGKRRKRKREIHKNRLCKDKVRREMGEVEGDRKGNRKERREQDRSGGGRNR